VEFCDARHSAGNDGWLNWKIRLEKRGSSIVERVLQLLDDLDDVIACVMQARLTLAWRGAGVAGLLAAVLAVSIPI
jgi:hypothetical protein